MLGLIKMDQAVEANVKRVRGEEAEKDILDNEEEGEEEEELDPQQIEIEEEFRVWRKNAPHLYDAVISRR